MAAPHSAPLATESTLDAAKSRLRADARALRDRCDPAFGQALASRLFQDCTPPPAAIIAGFWPMGSEIDIRPLLSRLAARGHLLALPVTPSRGRPLTFRAWAPGATLRPGPFGTHEPAEGEALRPDWLLVPLLAFDREGRRLGYGGGFYDRTLATLPDAVAIGVAYAAQEVAAVPVGPFDSSLDAIVTEREVVRRPATA